MRSPEQGDADLAGDARQAALVARPKNAGVRVVVYRGVDILRRQAVNDYPVRRCFRRIATLT